MGKSLKQKRRTRTLVPRTWKCGRLLSAKTSILVDLGVHFVSMQLISQFNSNTRYTDILLDCWSAASDWLDKMLHGVETGQHSKQQGWSQFGIKTMGLDMNEGGLTGLNVRCVEVLTFFGAKDASRNCQWWQIIETRIETFPKLWQEAVNGQKHMDAASAASKAREAYHLQSSNWHRGNLKRSVCRVQIGLNIFEQSSIFEEAVTLPYPSQRWTLGPLEISLGS